MVILMSGPWPWPAGMASAGPSAITARGRDGSTDATSSQGGVSVIPNVAILLGGGEAAARHVDGVLSAVVAPHPDRSDVRRAKRRSLSRLAQLLRRDRGVPAPPTALAS